MTFNPVNELERAIVATMNKPSARPEFYRTLIDSLICIVPIGNMSNIKSEIIKQDVQIKLAPFKKDGYDFIPFYSSPNRIGQLTKNQTNYITVSARTFFTITKGAYLILNPDSTGKEFSPQDIVDLLDGSFFEPHVIQKISKGQQIHIGQPAQYPHKLTSSFVNFFKGISSVKKAFLAQYILEEELETTLLICVDCNNDKDWDRIMGDANIIMTALNQDHKFVDLIRYEDSDNEPFVYFKRNVKPFYRRSFITSLFGGVSYSEIRGS